MSRISRIAFLVAIAVALTVVGGLDLRLALASRELATDTAVLDEHERHPNGMGVVITNSALDEHERRAQAGASVTYGAALDAHERRAASVTSYGAALDEHERRAASR